MSSYACLVHLTKCASQSVGNELLSDGPKHHKAAIDAYTRGIEAKSSDAKMNSALHSNRYGGLGISKRGCAFMAVETCRVTL